METGRVEAFSDGVFAIAITLLILAVGIEQGIAKGDVQHQLLHQLWPAYIAYAVSFLTVGIMWVNHHQVFRHFERVDREAAAVLYGLTMTLTAICFFSVWMYGSRRLLRPDADLREVSGITRSYLPGTPMYAIATIVAFFSPIASLI